MLLSDTGKPSEAEAEYRKAIAIQQKLADDNPAVTEFRDFLADQPQQPRRPAVRHGQAVGGGGRVPQGDGDPAEAGRRQPRRHSIPPSTWRTSHLNLGSLLSKTGKPSEAEAEHRKALAIQQKLANDNPAVTDFRSRLADSHSQLAMLLSQNGEPAKALDFRQAYEIYQKLADGNHTTSASHWRLSNATSPTCCWRPARQPRRLIPIAKLWRSGKSWLTKIPVSCSKPDKIKADF